MKTTSNKYCSNCGKMNTINPKHSHKKCKFCGQHLWPPLGIYTTPNPRPPDDPDEATETSEQNEDEPTT